MQVASARMEGTRISVAGREPMPVSLPPLAHRPLVSVLIGNFNYARYLPACLDSLLGQTYSSWEAIICDDGSTDNSRLIIADYVAHDSRFKCVYKENGGHGSALNAAFAASSGQVIALLDADDTFLPDKLNRVIDLLRAQQSVGMVIHRMYRMGEDEHRRLGKAFPDSLVHGWCGDVALNSGGVVRGVPPTSGLSLRLEIAEQLFPIPSAFRRAADSYLFRIGQFITCVGRIEDGLALYRIHGANVTAASTSGSESARKLVEDYQLVFTYQKKFLRERYTERVAEKLHLRQAPGYSDFALDYYLRVGMFPAGTEFQAPADAIAAISRPLRRWLWKSIFSLPLRWRVPVVRRLMKTWWGESRVKHRLRQIVRGLRF